LNAIRRSESISYGRVCVVGVIVTTNEWTTNYVGASHLGDVKEVMVDTTIIYDIGWIAKVVIINIVLTSLLVW
jgi:hypothetical protein